ncbi:MAG: hypothetical protein SCH68_11305 [Brevefilum sp.]|nr:hypothetical protein [Brevefilum sp.]
MPQKAGRAASYGHATRESLHLLGLPRTSAEYDMVTMRKRFNLLTAIIDAVIASQDKVSCPFSKLEEPEVYRGDIRGSDR